jgi:hypothetical protein
MKPFVVFYLTTFTFLYQGLLAQCHLAAPDSLRTVPDDHPIFQGDTVTFITYGGLGDSSSWYAFYGEECCVSRLDSNKTGVFTFIVWSSDIFYSRIESYCDTTWGASLDVDVWPRVTGISSPDPLTGATLSTSVERDTASYDLLGRKIYGEIKGFYIIKKRLFFK